MSDKFGDFDARLSKDGPQRSAVEFPVVGDDDLRKR
jgi:hypothetical protein